MDTQNSDVPEEESQEERTRTGVPYPVETVPASLAVISKLVSTFGSSAIITKEDISKETGRKVATLNLHYSTYQQYGILEKVHGKGFRTTSVYRKYADKIYPNHERDAQREMFSTPPLYAKIIQTFDNQYLPAEEKFALVLTQEPYNVNPSSADRAARIFFENIRALGMLVNNKFQFHAGGPVNTPPPKHEDEKPAGQPNKPPQHESTPNMITVTIPFKNKGAKATLTFPEDYEDSDMDKIARIVQAYKEAISQ